MTWSCNTGSPYHTQDTGYYCGAAAAMMILREIGVSYADLDQDDLYTSNHNHNLQSGWATDPYGLCWTLNDRRPAAFLPNFFVVYKPLTEAEGTRDVVWTLYHYHVSPAILVYHCQHWNVVRGVQTDVDPGAGAYTVEGFWINNPVAWVTPPPPPHDDTDGCGTGGVHGVVNEFVTYTEWQTNRFNGCSYDSATGARQWLSVCDPEPRTIELPRMATRQYLHDGRTLVRAAQVDELALNQIERLRLASSEFAAGVLKQGKFGKPVLVMRLDRPGEFYYLMPWEISSGTTALTQVDARYGVFKSLQVLSAPRGDLLLGGDGGRRAQERVAHRVEGLRVELPELAGRTTILPGTYSVAPTLVWKPCRESWSPAMPFHQVNTGPITLYVRIDGEVFTSLTDGHGG